MLITAKLIFFDAVLFKKKQSKILYRRPALVMKPH